MVFNLQIHTIFESKNALEFLACPGRPTRRELKTTGYGRVTWHWGAFVQPLLQRKCNKYYILRVCVCSLRYPACNAHAPYCHLWPARLYNTYLNYPTNSTFFEKQLLKTKGVFWFSLQFFSETFFILRIIERFMIKSVNWSSSKVPLILVSFERDLNILDRS